MSLFARILPALVTLAAAAVVVGTALPASSGTVRLASGTLVDNCHHWHGHDDSDRDDDGARYEHSRYDHNDRGLIVLHNLL